MTRLLNYIYLKIDFILKWFAAILLGVMALIIFAEVLSRYIFQTSIPWSEELGRFLFIWVTFVGAIIAGRNNEHIGIDFFQNILGVKLKKIVKIISLLITSFFFGMLAYLGISVFGKLMSQTSPAMELPIGIPYLGIIIGSLMLSLLYALRIVSNIKEGNKE